MADVNQHRLYGWLFCALALYLAHGALTAARPIAAGLLLFTSIAVFVSGTLLLRQSRWARATALGLMVAMVSHNLVSPAVLGRGHGVGDVAMALVCAWTLYDLATMPVTVSEARAALKKARRVAAMAVHTRDQLAAGLREAANVCEQASTILHAGDGHEAEWQNCGHPSCTADRDAVAEARRVIAELTSHRDLA